MSARANALFAGRIFPGLRAFEPHEALLFFGRDEQTDELLRRLDDTRFLAVVGLSGSGKSSLVRAGLLPALRRGHLASAGSSWRVAVMRPGSDPFGNLARQLNEVLGERTDRLATLQSGRLGLLDASLPGRKPDDNLLVVADQFEELFRFIASYRQGAGEAADFVERLLAATQEYDPEYRVYVVITLRSDYLGECARFRGLPEALNESQYLVPRMGRDQLREAIQGPASLGALEVASELLEELLNKTGDDPDQLPVLQHLLMRMWEIRHQSEAGSRLTMAHYEAVGGWDDALNRDADDVVKALGDRRGLAKRIFQRLTAKGETGREMRRPATMRELTAVAGVSCDEVKAVVERFRAEGCNFLTSPDATLTPDSVIDITHESLIRRWIALNKWVQEEANWGEWYRRVEDRWRIQGAFLSGPELEAALQACRDGEWNEAWAARYSSQPVESRSVFGSVKRFLDECSRRRTDEISRLRRTRQITAVAALLFAALAIGAVYFGIAARRASAQARSAEAEARRARQQLIVVQAEADKNRLEGEAARFEKLGLTAQAEQLKKSAELARMSLEAVKKAAANRQQQVDLEYVARNYYVSPYAPNFSLWYSGSWYRRPPYWSPSMRFQSYWRR